MIAEATKSEEFTQAGSLEFAPTNGFQVSGSYADQLPAVSNGLKQLPDTWANLRHDLPPVCFDITTNDRQSFGELRFKHAVPDPFSCQCRPQDRKIGLPVILDSVNRRIHAINFQHSPV